MSRDDKAHSVDGVLSGRVGMSPVMVGRARPFARLAGIVDAAEVMTGDQPAVALVSGEPGIGKTRLVRELVAVAAGARRRRSASTAQPGSMGRPLDAVAGARRARPDRRRPGRRGVRRSSPRRSPTRPDRARRRGPPLDRHGERQPHRPHRPAAVAEPRDHRHVPAQRPVARPARRRARAAPRAPPLRRAGPPRPPRPHRGRRDGRRRSRRRPAASRRRRSSRRCTGAAAASRSSSRS